MAAEVDSSELIGKKTLSVNDEENNVVKDTLLDNGLPLYEVYKLAFNFYKDKDGKAVHFSYEDKLQLAAFSQQVLHGPLNDAIHKLPPLGTLDVVGKDRRLAWQKLGALSSDQARAGFVELLSRRCPLFAAYVEAHRREKNERERKAKEDEKRQLIEDEEKRKQIEQEQLIQEELTRKETIKRQIQQALNEQTYEQFRKYAEQQFPGDPEKQGTLIKQLQEQHYIQYMQQLQAAQHGEQTITTKSHNNSNHSSFCSDSNEKTDCKIDDSIDEISSLNESNEDLQQQHQQQQLIPARMWTRSDIQAFKQAVSQAEGDGVVRVGHGETVTVRVPTHPVGSRLFWEFCTDYYDIGFGVYFEYGAPSTDQVSVHVSESDDEDLDDIDEDIDGDDEAIQTGDIEAGLVTVNGVTKPLLTEIVPVFRRDCQNEVYAGCHEYPGQGVYLLKFDNSYSLWRSKTLYYRVYYTQ